MSLKITLGYTSPSPAPTCGFVSTYRAKGEAAYLSALASGTTMLVPVMHIGSYEGVLESNCCSGNTSPGTPWGVNAYIPVTITIGTGTIGPTTYYNAVITSPYSFPYDIDISGTFDETCSGTSTISFSVVYTAGNTSQTVFISNGSGSITPGCVSPVISSLSISSLIPSFGPGNQGSVAWNDPVLTPYYGEPYWSPSGITAWTGTPLTLPSLTLDSFTPTTITGTGEILEGTLAFSWIQEIAPSGGTIPYNSYTFQLIDTVVIGSTTVTSKVLGLRSATIHVVFNAPVPPAVLSTTLYPFRVLWSSGVVAEQVTISIP